VYFGYRSADLTDEARGRLDENLAVLNECPQVCVTINAYADDRESDKVRLSERRAQSVADYYLEMGISEDRVRARGLGEAPDSNSKEDPGPGDRNARRAESIPQNCATFIDED
jgi:outer membrane protein OmpA-like peptidoglycan-associated protein